MFQIENVLLFENYYRLIDWYKYLYKTLFGFIVRRCFA